VRATARGSAFVEENREETARLLTRPDRVGVDAEIIRRTLDGQLKISPDGTMRQSGRYLLVGREDAARPDPVQAAWLYAQMARWGQTSLSKDALRTAMAVFRPDLYDAALGRGGRPAPPAREAFAAFAGPAFDPDDVMGYLASLDAAKRA
jgi:NitT/TauT family transport system ATP-binding protein